MHKSCVLLICSQHLFGESMETILRAEKEVELIGPWSLGDQDICKRVIEVSPSVIVIADEDMQNKVAAELKNAIIEQYPEILVICTGLNKNVFRIFSTHTVPARGVDLLEAIHSFITRIQETTGTDHL